MNTLPTLLSLRGALLAALVALPAAAQGARIQIQSLERLAASANEVVDITLEGPTLKMAARYLEKDPETQRLVQNLQGIYVKTFEFGKPNAYPAAELEAIRSQLKTPVWTRVVSVQNKKGKESAEIYLAADSNGKPLGLVILSLEPSELAVVNIVGAIDMERLSALEGKLGVPRIRTDLDRPGKPLKEGERDAKR
jgi:hypothetical protein